MRRVLITGSNGYIGNMLLRRINQHYGDSVEAIHALDIKAPDEKLSNVSYHTSDIRSQEVHNIISENKIDTVYHLAAIISIAGTHSREYEYDVDVNGSANIIKACIDNNVERFVTTSSGAAYGYWPSNVDTLLTEDMPTRGNYEIPYSYHKWLVEEQLRKAAEMAPDMKQFIFRVGTILGKETKNPITDYLNKPKLLCLKGYPSEFVAIWDEDLVNILWKASEDGRPGTYNVAGTGAIGTRELAKKLGKDVREVSAPLLKLAFKILRPLRLVKYGPESIRFIQYRPVLDNRKLRSEFSYTPQKTTEEVFQYWHENNHHVQS